MRKAQAATATPHSATYRRLQKRLSATGWIALGSVVERNKPGQGGPRYQWSRRVAGKTVTVALSKEQFEWLKAAISNQRALLETLEHMHKLTLQYMWATLPSTTRRKALSDRTLGVN